jgi:hypothetical protein
LFSVVLILLLPPQDQLYMKKMLSVALPIIGAMSLVYLLAMLLVERNEQLFSNYPNWFSRFALMGATTIAIVRYRVRYNNLITFGQSMLVGMFSSIALSFVIAAHTYVLREYSHPTYNDELKATYRGILERQTDPKWTTAQIDRQLNERWAYYFTTSGGVIIELLGGVAVGLIASVSVGYMARRVKAD